MRLTGSLISDRTYVDPEALEAHPAINVDAILRLPSAESA
jgi:hypothetical protein